MSAPSTVFRQASNVRYGVLSIKASNALRSSLQQRILNDAERETLRDAATFLVKISDGARLASTGSVPARARPSQAIAALDYALGPIETLRTRINEDIGRYFSRMARAVNQSANDRLPENQQQVVRDALFFFETLHRSLVEDRQARRTVLGNPRRKVA